MKKNMKARYRIFAFLFVLLTINNSDGCYSNQDLLRRGRLESNIFDYDYYDYEDSYKDEEENEAYHEEEEQHSGIVSAKPSFTIQGQNLKVQLGHTIRLPCLVDKLGPTVISWKRIKKDIINYLAMGKHKMTSDPRLVVEQLAGEKGSVLAITLAQKEDLGEYICEVSSQPPVELKHSVSLLRKPKVEIETDSEMQNENGIKILTVKAGDDLKLVCEGSGDPQPALKWTRQSKLLPDGQHFLANSSDLFYENITRKHMGVYVCEGTNGPGVVEKDSIEVNVLHSPEISSEETYNHGDENGISLELTCIVIASPAAEVKWFKEGLQMFNGSGITLTQNGLKHVLKVSDLKTEDNGNYECVAENTLGRANSLIRVTGSFGQSFRHTLINFSPNEQSLSGEERPELLGLQTKTNEGCLSKSGLSSFKIVAIFVFFTFLQSFKCN